MVREEGLISGRAFPWGVVHRDKQALAAPPRRPMRHLRMLVKEYVLGFTVIGISEFRRPQAIDLWRDLTDIDIRQFEDVAIALARRLYETRGILSK